MPRVLRAAVVLSAIVVAAPGCKRNSDGLPPPGGGGGGGYNNAPLINGLTLAPTAPTTTDDIVATASAFDYDGDPITLTYSWQRNDMAIAGQTGATLPASETAKADVITVTVRASDGQLAATASANVTIGDAPAVLTAAIPATVTYGEPFTLPIEASDPDGDAIGDLALAWGPAGMAVSAGAVSWTPNLPMFDRAMDVRFGVTASAQPGATLTGTLTVVDAARAPPLRRTGVEIPSWQNGLVAGDLDGDGDVELLVAGRRGVFELARDGAGWAQVWAYPFAEGHDAIAASVAARDVDGDGAAEIFVSLSDVLVKLDGVARREEARVHLHLQTYSNSGPACADLEVADLDADGALEVACLHGQSTYTWEASAKLLALDAATLATEWETGALALGRDFSIGQLDADAALEVATNGGFMLDGASGATEWAYGPGFGGMVDTGDLDGDGVEEIVGATTSKIVGYSGAYASPLWEVGTTVYSPESLLVADVDGDGSPEIALGNSSWGPVTVWRYRPDTVDAALAFEIANPVGGASALAAADLDGDGARELAWGASGYSLGDVLVMAGPDGTGAWAEEWASREPGQLDGPFVGARLAATGGGDRLLFATATTGSGSQGTRIVALDPAGGTLTVSAVQDRNYNPVCLDAADFDGDGVDEAFLGTAQYYTGYFDVYDPALGTTVWTSPPDLGRGRAVVAADVSGDGAADLVAITEEGNVHVFDVAAGTSLWKSVAIGGAGVDVAVEDVDGDGSPEIVALSSTRLVVYRRSTSAPVPWLEDTQAAVSGGVDLEIADADGDGTPELYVLAGTWTSTLYRFDGSAAPLGQATLATPAVSLHLEDLGAGRQNLVVGAGGSYTWDPVPSVLKGIDPVSGAEIWSSPPLHGAPSRNSVRYVDWDGDGDRDIAFGTATSMFLTR